MMARPNRGPGVLHRRAPDPSAQSSSRIAQVPSVLPSSTTTISCGTSWSRSSRWRCSTVEAMHPSSSRAGMTTRELRQRGQRRVGSGGVRHAHAVPESASQSGCASAWRRISSRMSGVRAARGPAPGLRGQRRVEDEPGDVERRGAGRPAATACSAEALPAPALSCAKRQGRARRPPETLTTRGRPRRGRVELALEQRDEVGGVEAVPHLVPPAAEADVPRAAAGAASCGPSKRRCPGRAGRTARPRRAPRSGRSRPGSRRRRRTRGRAARSRAWSTP